MLFTLWVDRLSFIYMVRVTKTHQQKYTLENLLVACHDTDTWTAWMEIWLVFQITPKLTDGLEVFNILRHFPTFWPFGVPILNNYSSRKKGINLFNVASYRALSTKHAPCTFCVQSEAHCVASALGRGRGGGGEGEEEGRLWGKWGARRWHQYAHWRYPDNTRPPGELQDTRTRGLEM